MAYGDLIAMSYWGLGDPGLLKTSTTPTSALRHVSRPIWGSAQIDADTDRFRSAQASMSVPKPIATYCRDRI
jgi:hypothetical protein